MPPYTTAAVKNEVNCCFEEAGHTRPFVATVLCRLNTESRVRLGSGNAFLYRCDRNAQNDNKSSIEKHNSMHEKMDGLSLPIIQLSFCQSFTVTLSATLHTKKTTHIRTSTNLCHSSNNPALTTPSTAHCDMPQCTLQSLKQGKLVWACSKCDIGSCADSSFLQKKKKQQHSHNVPIVALTHLRMTTSS